MANAYKCDRCGVFFTNDDYKDIETEYVVVHSEPDVFYACNHAPAHLCPKCSESLHRWMEQEPESGTHTIYLNVHRNDDGRPKTFKNKKKRWWRK